MRYKKLAVLSGTILALEGISPLILAMQGNRAETTKQNEFVLNDSEFVLFSEIEKFKKSNNGQIDTTKSLVKKI